MLLRAFILILLTSSWALFPGPDAREGRRGNALYENEAFDDARERYRAGLEAARSDTPLRARLWTNLGLAHYRQGEHAEAAEAFEEALDTAHDADDRARAAYNAGNNAAAAGNVEAALAYYREALRADPDHDDARFNYEYLQREQEAQLRQQPQPSPPEDIDPSPFAERLKLQADSLVARQQYRRATELMQQGLTQDSTVRAFQDFMRRLEDVVQIEDADPASDEPTAPNR